MIRASSVNQAAMAITGGTITGLSSPLPASSGGTGATTFSSIDPTSVSLTGGTINGVVIGGTTPAAATITNLNATGIVTLKGTTTNDSAALGNIGEIVTSTVTSGAAVTLSNAAGANVTNVSLTAGDWDVHGQVDFILAGVTATLFQSGISLTTGTLPTQPGGSGLGPDGVSNVPLLTTVLSATYGQPSGPVRLSVSTTSTVFLVADGTFSVGTLTAYGTIRARRVR